MWGVIINLSGLYQKKIFEFKKISTYFKNQG